MREGAVDYITKPLNFDEMHVVLQRALRTGNGARGKRPRGPMMLIGDSPVMQKLRSAIEMVADSSASVLIQGESGTGKEVVARAIHARSARADKPFVSCSCGAFAETLLMSELFGHERGAFTGAYELKKGLFEQADGGTLLLDEIAETSPQCQTALLRALATREVARVGHKESVPVDFRLLSATNKNLYDEVCSGRFREDLYYRINVVIINVPALRERAEDIPVLAEHFLRRFRGEQNKPIEAVSPEAMDVLLASKWPGNVRQLESAIEHAVLMCTASRIRPGDLPAQVSGGSATPASLPPSLDVLPIKAAIDVFQKHYLGQVLEKTDGNVSEAAKLAQIARQSFYEMMRRLGLEPSSYRA
jgi:two-component system response regulator HydG